MKRKYLFLCLPLIFSLLFTACGNTGASTEVKSNTAVEGTDSTSVTIDNPELDTALSDSTEVIDTTTERDNTPKCLETSAPGILTTGNEYATIDYSNATEGYIMVDYLGTNQKVKLQITGPNGVTYTYNLTNGYAAFPLTSGDGDYEISVCENISGNKYTLSYRDTLTFTGISEFGPYLYPNQYVYFTRDNKVITKAANLAAYCKDEVAT